MHLPVCYLPDFTSCLTAPSSPPLNVTAMAKNATAILVSWETPPIMHHNALLTGFRVQYRNTILLLSSTIKQIEVASPEQLYAVVIGLTPYTAYSVKVAVVNSVGSGPYSKEVSVQTLKSGKRCGCMKRTYACVYLVFISTACGKYIRISCCMLFPVKMCVSGMFLTCMWMVLCSD